MCGRFTLRASAERVAGEFLVILLEPLPPRYNIAPSQAILVLVPVGQPAVPQSLPPGQSQARASPSGQRISPNRVLISGQPQSMLSPSGEIGRLAESPPAPTEQPHSPRPETASPNRPTPMDQAVRAATDRQVVWMQWGFRQTAPSAGQASSLLINLRAETALEHPNFRRLLEAHRCLILADGFYEWEKIGSGSLPYFVHRWDDRPFGMAGLWRPPDLAQPWLLPECVVLTTPANALLRPIHDRMPALLLPEDYALWLDPEQQDAQKLGQALQPYPDELLEAYPVSQRINSADYDQPDCLQPQNRPRQRRLFEEEEE